MVGRRWNSTDAPVPIFRKRLRGIAQLVAIRRTTFRSPATGDLRLSVLRSPSDLALSVSRVPNTPLALSPRSRLKLRRFRPHWSVSQMCSNYRPNTVRYLSNISTSGHSHAPTPLHLSVAEDNDSFVSSDFLVAIFLRFIWPHLIALVWIPRCRVFD